MEESIESQLAAEIDEKLSVSASSAVSPYPTSQPYSTLSASSKPFSMSPAVSPTSVQPLTSPSTVFSKPNVIEAPANQLAASPTNYTPTGSHLVTNATSCKPSEKQAVQETVRPSQAAVTTLTGSSLAKPSSPPSPPAQSAESAGYSISQVDTN